MRSIGNLKSWEPSQHLLIDTGKPRKARVGKPRKTCVEIPNKLVALARANPKRVRWVKLQEDLSSPIFTQKGLRERHALAGLKYSLHKANLHSVVWHQRTGTASFKMAIEEAERDVRGIEVRGWKSDASCRVTLVPRQSVLCGGRGSPDYQAIRITKRNSVVQAYSMLTPWCRVLPEQLTGLQLVNKFPAFHGTRRFITALTSVRFCAMLPLETLPPPENRTGE